MKRLSYLFLIIAIILSDVMCAVVGYSYRDMQCGIEHAGYSAPASVALYYAIPFLIVIIVCVVLWYVLGRNKEV